MSATASLRSERAADADAIRALTAEAFEGMPFSSGAEPAIVDRLRGAGALTLSLVAEEDGRILGHAAFSSVTINGRDCGWFALGPISVAPSRQRRGIGGLMIREGLDRLRGIGAEGCVLLGDPAYYGRFGFEADPRLRYGGAPARYFQRLSLGGAVPAGEARFHPAFDAAPG